MFGIDCDNPGIPANESPGGGVVGEGGLLFWKGLGKVLSGSGGVGDDVGVVGVD